MHVVLRERSILDSAEPRERSTVSVIEIRIAHGAVLTAPELVSVSRKPPVEPVSERTHERDFKQPRYHTALRQHRQQFFECGRGLPGLPIGRANHLHRFHVRARGNPWKSR